MTESAAGRIDEHQLGAIVQRNADLADAQHAQTAPLCIYLLDMREYFRWQRRFPLDVPLARAELGAWIGERERHWEHLRTEVGDAGPLAGFRPILPGLCADPFATDPVREALTGAGLVFGAGIGRFGRPHFFLGRLAARESREGNEILVCGEELARGAVALPAMSRGNEILVRQDALERWLWSRYEEWRLHPHDNGLALAFDFHAKAPGDSGDAATIRRMAALEREALILHELGERRIDGDLGDAWHDLIEEMPSRKAEILVRSVRDLLADCTVTLPELLGRGQSASVHCWFGLLDGVRQKLAPGMVDAYQRWRQGDRACLDERLIEARQHWRSAAATVLRRWQHGGAAALEDLRDDGSLIFR